MKTNNKKWLIGALIAVLASGAMTIPPALRAAVCSSAE